MKLKQLKLEGLLVQKITQMICKLRKTPMAVGAPETKDLMGVETPETKETEERVAKKETTKKEIGKKIMAQERRKIMVEDRMATTKERTTEINLIGKIPFL